MPDRPSTLADPPRLRTLDLPATLRGAARLHPQRAAIECRGETITYDRLDGYAAAVAHCLIDHGLALGEPFGILHDDPVQIIASIVAGLRAACAFAPLEPAQPDARLRAMLAVIQPRLIVTSSALADRARGLLAGLGTSCALHVTDGDQRGAAHAVDAVDRRLPPDAACSIYFTSGSTGEPKAIAGRLAGIEHFLAWESDLLEIPDGVRASHLLAPSFDGSLRDLFMPLCSGGTICVPPSRDVVLDTGRLAAWAASARVALVHCVPSMLRVLLHEVRPGDLPALRWILVSGEPLLPSDVGRWADAFDGSCRLVNLYGTTETTMAKFAYLVQPDDRDRRMIPVGTPMLGAAALVVDDRGRPCAPNALGEIYIRTPYRSHGYYQRPDLTNEVFVPNPFGHDPSDVVYKTGDLGRRLEDGRFEVVGRKDRQVKIRGIRIELEEIEAALRQHPAVREAAVTTWRDDQNAVNLAAYVVAPGTGVAVLRAHLRTLLPEPMIPARFIKLDQLPHTVSGKVDRQSLPAPESFTSGDDQSADRPLRPTEEAIAAIWRQVFKLEHVAPDVSFFDLGGHSLLATRLLSRVRAVFEVDVSVAQFFSAPTIAGLAAQVDATCSARTLGTALPPITPADRARPLPLSFAQRRLWILDASQEGDPAYNMPRAARLAGPLDIPAFARALNALVARHESLRTIVVQSYGEPEQRILPPTPVPLPLVDLSGLPEARREREAKRQGERLIRQRVEISQGPLFNSYLLRLAPTDHIYLGTIHHLVTDGWSLDVFIEDIASLYAAALTGRDDLQHVLSPLAIQYADFAAWQRTWLDDELIRKQVPYWHEVLADAPRLALPTDRPPRAIKGTSGAVIFRPLSASAVERLRTTAAEDSTTLFVALLAAFNVLLHRYTGQDDLLVGIPISGRPLETERLIGFFVNTLAIRTRVSSRSTYRDVLRQVRASVLRATAYQDVPFDALVSALQPDRHASANPIFDVMFAFQPSTPAPPSPAGLSWSAYEIGTGIAKFDLVVAVLDAGGWTVGAEYRTELFDRDTIERLLDHAAALVEHVASNPDVRAGAIPLVSGAELANVLRWGGARSTDSSEV